MATIGTVVSYLMTLSTGATPTAISCQVNAKLDLQRDMRDNTCKNSGLWTDALPSTMSWSMSGSLNFAFDATNGYSALHAAMIAGTSVALVFSTGVTGDKKYTGSGYVTKLSIDSSGSQNNVTADFEFTGVGALTEGTVS